MIVRRIFSRSPEQPREQIPVEDEIQSRDFRPEVAKQHDVSSLHFSGVTIVGEVVSARTVS